MFAQPTSQRVFQLWEYRVSHGSLLIRSPKSPSERLNIDIACVGVEYMAVPRCFQGVQICEATDQECAHLEGLLQRSLDRRLIHILASGEARFPIVASSLRISEHDHDIFHSPFD